MSHPSANTDLAHYIAQTPLCDTHEHLRAEEAYVDHGPDILQSLFENYVSADLIVAGASEEAVAALLDGANPDIRSRFAGVAKAWAATQHTGYGEAVRLCAKLVYGLDEIDAASIEAAQNVHAELRKPGERLRLLRDVANLDHVQIDNFVHPCPPDRSGPDFFLYDISWVDFANGKPDLPALAAETNVEVSDLASLRRAMEATFAQNGETAVAVKSQHAYNRTLSWEPRSDGEAARALASYLHDPDAYTAAEALCLGDWCLTRGIELAVEHDLPIKLHTGYYAGHSRMPVDYIRAGNLCRLLATYLDARFVLMHIAYPYNDELVALTKHYPNVYADFCWAWSIDPYSTSDFLRRCIHAAPANKLFIFGGDTAWPTAAVAYAAQARAWLTRTLQAEIADGLLTEKAAMDLAERYMHANQFACFRVEQKKAMLRKQAASA